MILNNSKPEYSLYYIGGVILNIIKDKGSIGLSDLYNIYKNKTGSKAANFSYMLMALDWIYLLDVIVYEDGKIQCI